MKHREVLNAQAIENGESVEDWDKIVLSGAKIKQTTSSESVKEESWGRKPLTCKIDVKRRWKIEQKHCYTTSHDRIFIIIKACNIYEKTIKDKRSITLLDKKLRSGSISLIGFSHDLYYLLIKQTLLFPMVVLKSHSM